MSKKDKYVYQKTPDGKTMRISAVDIESAVSEKIKNNDKLKIHKAQIDIYKISDNEIVERKLLDYAEAVAFGKEVKEEFPELGYRIIQIVE